MLGRSLDGLERVSSWKNRNYFRRNCWAWEGYCFSFVVEQVSKLDIDVGWGGNAHCQKKLKIKTKKVMLKSRENDLLKISFKHKLKKWAQCMSKFEWRSCFALGKQFRRWAWSRIDEPSKADMTATNENVKRKWDIKLILMTTGKERVLKPEKHD